MLVAPGPASKELGVKVAKAIEAEVVEVESKFFPDGETYIRFAGEIKDRNLVIVQSTYPPQDTHLNQLLLLIDAARSQGAAEITAAVPYLAYSRQDKAFRPYEAVSIKTVLRLMAAVGLSRLITVDIHTPEAFKFAGFPCQDLQAVEALAGYFLKLDLGDLMAFAPDVKAGGMAKKAAQVFNGDYGWFNKERDRVSGAIHMEIESQIDVKGRNIVLFDDIISSGGTTATAVNLLKAAGAHRIFSACTHPLLIDNAYQRIMSNGAESVVGTDSIPSHVSRVSVAPLVAKALKT